MYQHTVYTTYINNIIIKYRFTNIIVMGSISLPNFFSSSLQNKVVDVIIQVVYKLAKAKIFFLLVYITKKLSKFFGGDFPMNLE